MTIRLAIIVAPGFGQQEADPSHLRETWRELHDQYAGAESYVFFREQDSDWRDMARIIDRDLHPSGTLVYVGHSYGAGKAFLKLCKHLKHTIDLAVLLDAVPSALRWFGLAGLLRTLRITRDNIRLPEQVRVAITRRQANAAFYGRAWVPSSDAQTIDGIVYGPAGTWHLPHETPVKDKAVRHDTIDGLPAVRTTIRGRIDSLVQARRGR